jgi:hypothetical protein
MGLAYGSSVSIIAWIMEPMELMKPQSLNVFHIIGIIVMTMAWLSVLFVRVNEKSGQPPIWLLKSYVVALNASQPDSSTVTACRNQYRYL